MLDETFLQNVLLKAILIPFSLAFASAALDLTSALVRGRGQGAYKFRLWIELPTSSSHPKRIVPLLNQSLDDIQTRTDVIDVDCTVNFDLANLGSVAINLIIAAFTVDITILIEETSQPKSVGFVLLIHLLLLIGIVISLMFSEHTNPKEINQKRISVAFAILFGLAAMIAALFAS